MPTEPDRHEALLADTRWLQRLLERLVADRHTAEDLYQDTLLAAWAQPPEGPMTRSWLSRVARNLAASFRSRSRQRAKVEGAASSERRSPAPPELIVEAELQGRAVEAVLALDEPYRTTVLLRYMRGRSSEEVAREMAVPVETVRSRQRRALEVLRQKLDVRDRRRAWLPMAWLSWAKMAAVMTMSKKTALALVSVLTLLALTWSVLPRSVGESPANEAGTELSIDAVALESQDHAPDPYSPALTAPRDLVVNPKTASLELLLTWKETQKPAHGIPLRLSPRTDDPGLMQFTDSSGLARFEDLEPGTYSLMGLYSNLRKRFAMRGGETLREGLTLDQGLRGTVTVLDPLGSPVGDARIVGVQGGVQPAWTFPLGRTDERGRWKFRGLHSYHSLGASSDGLGSSPMLMLFGEVLADNTTRAITLTLPGHEGSVSGRVFGPNGGPVLDAVLFVQYEKAGGQPESGGIWSRPPSPSTHSDADGRFSLEALHTTEADLVVLQEGYAPYSRRIDLAHGPLSGQAVVLEEGAMVEGKITDERGQPISSADCRVVTASKFKSYHPSVAADGSFRLEHLPSGTLRIEISSSYHSAWQDELTIADGMTYQLSAVLERIETQRCRLIDAEGRPLAGWWFNDRPSFKGKTDEQGFFELAMRDGHRDTLHVWDDWMMGPIIHSFGPLEAQSALLTLTLPAESMPSNWLLGRVLGSKGESLANIAVRITQLDVSSFGRSDRSVWADKFETDAQGDYRIGPLPPGRYLLRPLHADLMFPPAEVVLATNEQRDLGSLKGELAASLTIILEPASAVDAASLVLLDEHDRTHASRSNRNQRITFAKLFPGSYRIALVEDGETRVLEEVVLLAGDEREMRLAW